MKQRIKLDIFVNFLKKETFFYTLKQQWFFLIPFYSFEDAATILLNRTLYVFYKLPSATNQQLFCITERDIGQGPLNHIPALYELLSSVLWLTLSFGEVSMTCRRMQ